MYITLKNQYRQQCDSVNKEFSRNFTYYLLFFNKLLISNYRLELPLQKKIFFLIIENSINPIKREKNTKNAASKLPAREGQSLN